MIGADAMDSKLSQFIAQTGADPSKAKEFLHSKADIHRQLFVM